MKTMKIYGPPGTGKTTFLLSLFEQELKRTKSNRIGFLTFTRAARLEALRRSGFVEDDLPFLRTIHAICYRQLGVTQGQIVKPKDLRDLAQQTGMQFSYKHDDPWESEYINFSSAPTRDDMLLQLNHLGRHRMIGLREAIMGAPTEIEMHYAKWFTQTYRKWKSQESLLDYTDLLSEYLEHGEPLPIDVLFIDEAQDLSRLQWLVVKKLGSNARQVYMAGDDDQAIFTWAGASPEAFIDEPADEIKFLDQSYRVPGLILDVANEVITRVRKRADKPLKPRSEPGTVGTVAYLDDESLSASSTLVLFRNHHRGRLLREQLQALGWPFLGEGSPLSDAAVQRTLSGWAELQAGRSVSSLEAKAIVKYSEEELINKGIADLVKRDNSKTWTIRDLYANPPKAEEWPDVLAKIPNIPYLVKAAHFHGYTSLLKPTTQLMSIHQSKGGEAETVILDVEMARKTYDSWFRDPEDEHRVWYVAVTRAKQKLLTIVPEGLMYYQL